MVLFPLSPVDPAARLDAFLKAHPAFVATVDVSINGKPVAKTTLRVVRPRRLRFDAKGERLDFTVTSTEDDYIEMERTTRTYDQRPSTGGFRLYDSRFSSAPGLLPPFLVATTTAAILGGAKPTVTAVAGGDELKAILQTQNGPLELRLLIDPQGRPIRFVRGGVVTWRLVWFADAPPDLAPFRIVPPLGYVPYALPDLPFPLQIGEAAPLAGWRQGARTVDLGAPSRGKPRLLAVLADASPPSAAARPFLTDLAKTMPVFVIGPGGVADPSGKLLRRLSPPGMPMFYLVGGDGKVAKLWFGFDAAKGAVWEAEVREAAQGGVAK